LTNGNSNILYNLQTVVRGIFSMLHFLWIKFDIAITGEMTEQNHSSLIPVACSSTLGVRKWKHTAEYPCVSANDSGNNPPGSTCHRDTEEGNVETDSPK